MAGRAKREDNGQARPVRKKILLLLHKSQSALPFMKKSTGNTFPDIVRRRRSIREFSGAPLSETEVVDLVRPALMAPSSKNRRAWELTLTDNAAALAALAACKHGGARFLGSAALAIVVCGRTDLSDVWVEDASVVAATLLYQAEAMGLGACWVQVRGRSRQDGTPAASIVRETLDLQPGQEPLCIIAVGRKAAELPPYDTEDLPWEKVHIR